MGVVADRPLRIVVVGDELVSGAGDPVTRAPGVSQCADTHTIARGRGSAGPSARQASDQSLSSMAFIGEPWPMNRTGIVITRSAAKVVPS